MAAITQGVLDGWQPGQQRDIHADMADLTQRIAMKTLLGLDPAEDTEHIGEKIALWMQLLGSPLTNMLRADIPGLPFHQLVRQSQMLEESIKAVIARKRANSSPGNDVLSTLLQARDEDGSMLTDDEVIGQTNVLFLAGHDTTANALTWTLFLLAQHPEVMADLLDELTGELCGDAPTVEQLGKLPLLERVINESMRLLPPATWVSRVATDPFELGPYSLPAGTTVILSHYITHHMPELYPDPDKFLPDRWLTINPSTYEYIPFSAGPRMCIGAHFATMEMKIVLAMLLQRYRLATLPGAKIDRKITFTMKPKNGLPMMVNEQDRCFTCLPVLGDVREMVELR
jgi:cytochrome P450